MITLDEKHDDTEVVSSAGRTQSRQFMSRGLILYKYGP